MRQLGIIPDQAQAELFANHLRSLGIACHLDTSNAGQIVWVQEEDRVDTARGELQAFLVEPSHERYRDANQKAAAATRQRQQVQKSIRKRTVDLRKRWERPLVESCPATFGLIAVTVLVAYFTLVDREKSSLVIERMLFSTDSSLTPILSGEVWRLVTPIFLHFGWMHLIFNLFYLRDFGFEIEYRIGTPKFMAMLLLIAVVSNYAQFALKHPFFGGMSGVNYGLFGYAWVRGRLDPESGFHVPNTTVTVMCGWHLMCLAGVIPNVANWAHGVGLIAGVTLGAIAPAWKNLR